ncbi:hypothetical protein [Massilia sp. TWR1-2-2]|uniref:hypothetical protein n=1 Tax=Massilia sp. TWR1-2-2 TaxID=2804584 RepID=UPI003CEF206C
MKIFTIGFTRTSAEDFFTRLKKSEAQRLVDVRLNNVSQLAGFAKRDEIDRDELAGACLLCSEDKPHH